MTPSRVLLLVLVLLFLSRSTAQAAEPAALPSEQTSTLTNMYPVAIAIPAIGLRNIPIYSVGLDAHGAMETPSGWWETGWFQYGPVPGQAGSSVIAGHYDSNSGPAVFWNLWKLRKGDKIYVLLSNRTIRTFSVESTEVYPFNRAPLDRIFAEGNQQRLNLTTCSGIFNPRTQNYSHRLVVYTIAIN